MGRTKPAVIAATIAGLALAAAEPALAQSGVGPPTSGTPSGRAINELYWFVFGICAVVFVLVETALILFILRFRRRPTTEPGAEGPQIHGNTRLEIIWTLIPAAILALIAVVVLVRTPAVQATGDTEGELVVRVEGHQFYWQYVYPEGQIAIDTLVLPVDRPVRLELQGMDVNHSWWVPDLAGKRDAIAGRVNVLRFRPTAEGSYEGECAEFCGIFHAVMPTTVDVVPEAEFEERLALLTGQEQRGAAQLALGRESWDRACAKCHGPTGEGDLGPPIARSGQLVDEEALTTILMEGVDNPGVPGRMPPVGRGWPQFQVQALIEYIRSNERLAAPVQEGDG